MNNFSGLSRARFDLPKFLDTNRITLWIGFAVEIKFFDELFGQVSARAFAEYGQFGFDIDTLGVSGFVATILSHTHIADTNTGNAPGVIKQHFGGSKTRVNFHTQSFSLRRQPGTHGAERHNKIAVVVHLWRRR